MCAGKFFTTENITSYKNLFECTDPQEFDDVMDRLLENPSFKKAVDNHKTSKYGTHKKAISYYSKFLHSQQENDDAKHHK